MANRENYTFTITKLYLQKPLHENNSNSVAFTCDEDSLSLEDGSETSGQITFKLIAMVGRGGSCSRSFGQNRFYKIFYLFHFQFINFFKRLNFLACLCLFFTKNLNLNCTMLQNVIFLLHPDKTLLHPTPVMSLAQQARSVTQSCFKDGGVSRRCCHRWRNKRSLCG